MQGVGRCGQARMGEGCGGGGGGGGGERIRA